MQLPPEEFERIVQEVIRRLLALTDSNAQAPATASRLVLEEPLITLAKLDGKLNGVSQVVVPAKAIVTPAVKDELRDKKIELVMGG